LKGPKREDLHEDVQDLSIQGLIRIDDWEQVKLKEEKPPYVGSAIKEFAEEGVLTWFRGEEVVAVTARRKEEK
jgi:hypothetical protein